METKNEDEAVLRRFRQSDYTNHFTVPPVGLSGGVSLSWKDSVSVDILFSSPNIIDTHLERDKRSMFVSFIYGALQAQDRATFWRQLSKIGAGRDEEAWLIVGDFNDLLDNSEKVGGPLCWEGSFLAFRSFVSQHGLWDLQHSGDSLSWRGTRYNYFIQSRLDRAMGNCKWSESFPTGCCEYLRFEGSDHRPILVHLQATKSRKRNLFRFDRKLVHKPEIRKLVDEQWQNPGNDSVLTKLCRVRRKIMEWTKAQNANSKGLIISTQQKLEEALSSATPDPTIIGEITQQLEEHYKEEEIFWRQRSRIQWLNCGDRNTAFFHASTRGRRAVNKFSVIEDEEGVAQYEEDKIANTIARYYSDIFSSQTRLQDNANDPRDVVEEVLLPLVSLR